MERRHRGGSRRQRRASADEAAAWYVAKVAPAAAAHTAAAAQLDSAGGVVGVMCAISGCGGGGDPCRARRCTDPADRAAAPPDENDAEAGAKEAGVTSAAVQRRLGKLTRAGSDLRVSQAAHAAGLAEEEVYGAEM